MSRRLKKLKINAIALVGSPASGIHFSFKKNEDGGPQTEEVYVHQLESNWRPVEKATRQEGTVDVEIDPAEFGNALGDMLAAEMRSTGFDETFDPDKHGPDLLGKIADALDAQGLSMNEVEAKAFARTVMARIEEGISIEVDEQALSDGALAKALVA